MFNSAKKRHRHKKGKNEEVVQEIQGEQNNGEDSALISSLSNPLNTISINELKAAMELYTLSQKPAKTPEEALKKSYQFWNTQPVPKMGNYY